MKHSLHSSSLMLTCTILFYGTLAYGLRHSPNHINHGKLAERAQLEPTPTTDSAGSTVSPCSGAGCVAAYPSPNSLPCSNANGTIIKTETSEREWKLLCDIDFYAQDIYPFILAGSFEECLKQCDTYNQNNLDTKCAGFVFAPDRVHMDNDCYLKSSTNNIIYPSTIHLVGATLLPQPSPSTASSREPAGSFSTTDESADSESGSSASIDLQAKVLGTSTNEPTKQYVSHLPALPVKLASSLLQPGINIELVTDFPLATDTGTWTESTAPFGSELANLSSVPRLSRDGGKGGNINGTHVFYFCDTSTFGDVDGPIGYMNGFVSSSVTVDASRDALEDNPLTLQDPIGQWQDDVGRLRGWIPLTAGEEAFNIAVSGKGYRYAVWPESSFISLNETHSVIYAPVVYVEVDMDTQHAQFTSLGNTLIAVSVDPQYGPHADRIVNRLFTDEEVEWGSLGGIRAWTATGTNTNDGMLYLFGQVDSGILLAKVSATDLTDRSAYSYWDGTTWSSTMQGKDSEAAFIQQPVMDVDIFYAPLYKTFLMVYLTPFADNTFYFRKLQVDHDILAAYLPDGDEDYVENIVRFPWSDPIVLFQAPAPASGFIYAGGCHLGYFEDEDLANGGRKLLITWTEHTEKDPNDPASGYAHKSAVIS